MKTYSANGRDVPVSFPKTHTVSVTKFPSDYPGRFPVPEDRVSWDVPFPEYLGQRVDFTAPEVLRNYPNGWAQSPNIAEVPRERIRSYGEVLFDAMGYPQNPVGRTGMGPGRGLLGNWGANFAADPIVTWFDEEQGELFMLGIERADGGGIAIPGGMADKGELFGRTLTRELGEETGVDGLEPDDATVLYAGYVDDWRNTDTAWMETIVGHWHISDDPFKAGRTKAGSDAKRVLPVKIDTERIGSMYASHGYFLGLALENTARLVPTLASVLERKISFQRAKSALSS